MLEQVERFRLDDSSDEEEDKDEHVAKHARRSGRGKDKGTRPKEAKATDNSNGKGSKIENVVRS